MANETPLWDTLLGILGLGTETPEEEIGVLAIPNFVRADMSGAVYPATCQPLQQYLVDEFKAHRGRRDAGA